MDTFHTTGPWHGWPQLKVNFHVVFTEACLVLKNSTSEIATRDILTRLIAIAMFPLYSALLGWGGGGGGGDCVLFFFSIPELGAHQFWIRGCGLNGGNTVHVYDIHRFIELYIINIECGINR